MNFSEILFRTNLRFDDDALDIAADIVERNAGWIGFTIASVTELLM